MSSSHVLRLLHLADLHLGAKCSLLKDRAGERSKDFERAFERAMEFARDPENDIDVVVIAGDLFDSHKPEPRLVRLVKSEFAALREAGTQIVLVPGTHDTSSYLDCVYREEDFGDILLPVDNDECPLRLDAKDRAVYIYPVVRGPDCSEVPIEQMTRTPADGVHIGVLHAAVQAESGVDFSDTELVATIPALASTRLDYIALGHYHNFKQYRADGVTVVYPGTLEGRSFRETGERYLVTVTFDSGGPVVEKRPFNERAVYDETIDLDKTSCRNHEELCAKVEQIADNNAIMRLTISGDAEFSIDTAAVEQTLADRFFYLEVVDDTRLYNAQWVEHFKQEPTVRGIFVRKMIEKIEKARTDDEKRMLDAALKFGLMELAEAHED
jgi:DNA repair exonuclease SbcCD nuclease subunit